MEYDSIMKCDIDVRRELYGNIVLSGGTKVFSGMRETGQGDWSTDTCADESEGDCARGAEVRSVDRRIYSGITCDISADGDHE